MTTDWLIVLLVICLALIDKCPEGFVDRLATAYHVPLSHPPSRLRGAEETRHSFPNLSRTIL